MRDTSEDAPRGAHPPKDNDAFPTYFRTSFKVFEKFSQLTSFHKNVCLYLPKFPNDTFPHISEETYFPLFLYISLCFRSIYLFFA